MKDDDDRGAAAAAAPAAGGGALVVARPATLDCTSGVVLVLVRLFPSASSRSFLASFFLVSPLPSAELCPDSFAPVPPAPSAALVPVLGFGDTLAAFAAATSASGSSLLSDNTRTSGLVSLINDTI